MEPPQPVSSRSSFSDPQVGVQGPVPLFDTHLKRLSDSYLTFFQERKRIEETYIDSLRRLHRKIKAVDIYLDDRGEQPTTRSVWSEIVENVEREAQARQAFTSTLSSDVINPLVQLKDTQDRTRKRIKEDIKDSTQAYTEYAEGMLPRLKTRYAKKFSEVEDQRRGPPQLPTSPLTSPTIETAAFNFNSRSTPAQPSTRPTVTGPQPLRALDRRQSLGSRNRSPGGGLSDLAHQGKGKLNQLIGGFLDKGGVKDTLSGGREPQALRTVRAKREADEADKEYRKGVHWLETLRLRRTKILESGYKESLERYTDHLTATYSTQSHLCSHARTCVDKISPERDLVKLKASIPRSLASAIPEPILYEHGQVGSCTDLIFGFSLADYATAKSLPEGEIPRIVKICIDAIDQRGLESEGIYRVSGRHAVVQALQHDIEKDESEFDFMPRDDIYAVASLLKLYLRELPEPVFRFPLQDRIQHTENRAEHLASNFMLLRSKIRRLPAVHQATLKALLEHLNRVVMHSEKNKMDPKNVSIVFGGVIFGEDEMPKGGDLLTMHTAKETVMEDLITYVYDIFDSEPEPPKDQPEPKDLPLTKEQTISASTYSPPLPPTPMAEAPIPQYYGSKSTKVATVFPVDPPSSSLPQDFTPRLPARPADSIHPSARNVSPTKVRTDAIPPHILQSEASSDRFSIPPSPSEISSSLDVDSVVLHSRDSSSGSSDSEETGTPATGLSVPPSPHRYPFPSNPTPDATPSRPAPPPPPPGQARAPAASAKGDDPFN
ncbi:hypothetical protein BKA70DRAFT_1485592 [Coprinopsis sp. MPI-PUGE-AT-0042]|nr:hypothetical protein BKA70DRAFT_1485592 [Coprinopsis sp. MPI-PUGE-AT-0042]